MKRACYFVFCTALWVASPAMGQDSASEEESTLGLGLSLRTSESEGGGLSLRAIEDLPNTRALAIRINECITLADEGRRQEALDKISALAKEVPANKPILMAQSVILMRNYKYREALNLLESLIERYPEDTALLNNAGWLYATADEPGIRNGRKAVELGKKALMIAPLNYHVWSTIAEGYYISGEFDRSLEAAQEGMRLALRSNADLSNLREYRNQILKNRKALKTFSLVN